MPDLFSGLSGLGGGLVFIVISIIAVGFILTFYILWKSARLPFISKRQFKVTVLILERRGDSIIPVRLDKARILTDQKNNENLYELWKSRVKITAFDFEHLTPNNWLIVFSPTRDEFHPVHFSVTKKTIITRDGKELTVNAMDLKPVMSETMKYVFANRTEKNYLKLFKPDFFQKYLPVILIFATALALTILIYAVLSQIIPVMEKMALSNTQAAQAIEGALQHINPTPTIPQLPPS